MQYPMTIYELTSSGTPARYFAPHKYCDACVRAAERIVQLDRDAEVGGGFVALKRLGDSVYPEGMTLLSWTKTSNECPTTDGELSPEAVSI